MMNYVASHKHIFPISYVIDFYEAKIGVETDDKCELIMNGLNELKEKIEEWRKFCYAAK